MLFEYWDPGVLSLDRGLSIGDRRACSTTIYVYMSRKPESKHSVFQVIEPKSEGT